MRELQLPYSMGATQTYLYSSYSEIGEALCSDNADLKYNSRFLKDEKKDDDTCLDLLEKYSGFFCKLGYDFIGSDKNNTCFKPQFVDFIKQNNNKGKDLSGKDLSGKDFAYANFSYANLTNANLSNTIFRNALLVNANLKGATLTGAIFENARLINADFTGATGADLTGAVFYNTICPDRTVTTPKDTLTRTGCQKM